MIPINTYGHCVFTVQGWKSAAPHFGARSWKSAMDRFALQHGKAIALLGNDGARIVERLDNGRLARHEFPPESIFWHNGRERLPSHI